MAFRTVRSEAAVAQYVVLGGPATEAVVGSTPVRLLNLPARAAEPVLSVASDGAVRKGALVAADIPAVFTRDDQVETITQPWVWSGSLQAPQASSRSVGTRIVYGAQAGSTEHATGMATNELWQSVPLASVHRWYTGATQRMELSTDGTLRLANGSGTLVLNNASTGEGAIAANSSLHLSASASGLIDLTSGTAQAVTPGVGYRENLGLLQKKWLTLHAAELWVETLVAQDTMATIGGRILVGPTTTLTLDVTSGQTFIVTKHNNVRQFDRAWLEAAGKFEIMAVLSEPVAHPSGWSVNVQRNFDGSGLTAWSAGDAVFNTGQPGNGFIDLYSIRGVKAASTAGPTIVGQVRFDSSATGWRPHWAIGNLTGLYGNGAVYGAAFGDSGGVHLQTDATFGIRMKDQSGNVYTQLSMAGNLTLGYPSHAHLYLDATSLKFRAPGGTDKLALDGTTGDLMLTGNIRSGPATAYATGTGFFLGWNADTPVFRIGQAPTGQNRRLEWTGATLRLVQDGLSIDENGIRLANGTEPSKQVSWGPAGPPGSETTVLRDSGPAFDLWHRTGTLRLINNDSTSAGKVRLQAGEAGVQQHWLELTPTTLFTSYSGPTAPTVTMPGGSLTFGSNASTLQFLHGSVLPAGGDYTGSVGNAFNRFLTVHTNTVGIALTPSGTAPAYVLHLGVDSAAKPASNLWTVPSDIRLKREIEPVNGEAALAAVRATRLIRYQYNGLLGLPEVRGIGVDAAQAATILPESVQPAGPEGYLGWNAHELVMCTIAAVQVLADRFDALEGKAH